MYEIKVTESFSGAHNLRHYKGKCEALHGHNWKIEVSLSGEKLNSQGMLLDFKVLKNKLRHVLSVLDHKFLNNLVFFKKTNPTSENIACFIYRRLSGSLGKKKIKVTVWETENSSASFTE